MNLILLRPEDFTADDAVRLAGRRARHVRKVLGARPGDTVRVGLLGGRQGPGRIVGLTHEGVELSVQLEAPPPPPLPHRLVLALPRPPALRRILKSTAALGVKRMALIDTAQVESSFWQSSQILPDRIEEQLCLGLEQARDTVLPEVTLHRRFAAFIDRDLPLLLEGARGFVGHPASSGSCPRGQSSPAVLVVGPEGGLVDDEVFALEDRGLTSVSLGPRPLAVDTAVIALLARLAP